LNTSSKTGKDGEEELENQPVSEDIGVTAPADSTPVQNTFDPIKSVYWSVLALLATIWNFHIDVLSAVGVLPVFVRQPLLFLGLCVVVSLVFPPFLTLYILAWLAAHSFGLSETTNYRVKIK
jgi:hypothetical protein